MKFAPEGYPFIAAAALLTLIVYLAGGRVSYALLPLAITLFMLWFFRDPSRTPEAPVGYVSPADGRVIVSTESGEAPEVGDKALKISIFMSPLDVHVNRAPCDGTVLDITHTAGKFFAAYKDEASLRNERLGMLLETPEGRVLVRQVAGFVARRAVCRVDVGDTVERGKRYGMIKFGSRLDVYMPEGSESAVRLGQVVRAGESIIAFPPSTIEKAGNEDDKERKEEQPPEDETGKEAGR